MAKQIKKSKTFAKLKTKDKSPTTRSENFQDSKEKSAEGMNAQKVHRAYNQLGNI